MEKRTEKLEQRVEALHADMTEIKVTLTGLGAKLDALNSKIDFGDLRSSVEKAHTDIYKWVATIAIATASLGFAIHSGLRAQGEASASRGQHLMQSRQPAVPGADAAPVPTPPRHTIR